MIPRILTLILISLFLTSCGSKKETVPVKLKIFQGNSTDLSVAAAGGVLIFGRSEDGKNSFRVGMPSINNGMTLDLLKGKWEFAAVAWEGGSGMLTGTNRCAYTGIVELKDNEVAVNFNLSTIRCSQTFSGLPFSEASFFSTSVPGKFLKFYPIMCFENTTSNMTTSSCQTSVNNSNLLGFKIVYPPEQKGNVSGAMSSLVSGCFGIKNGTYPLIPITGDNSPLGFSVQFFTDLNCNSAPVTYDFKNGVYNNTNPAINTVTPYGDYYSYFFINTGAAHHVPDATNVMMNFPSIAVGNDGVSHFSNSTNVPFTLTANIPDSAVEMCWTETTCSAGDWVPLATSGNVTISNTVGSHDIYLYFRNSSGNVSPTPRSNTFNYAPVLIDLNTLAATNDVAGVHMSFNLVTYSMNIATNVRIRICPTSACSTVLYEHSGNIDLSSQAYSTSSIHLLSAITTGTYYAELKATDLFGIDTLLTIPSLVLSYPLNP